jgi:DNA-binding XRE family transcriptional regulator
MLFLWRRRLGYNQSAAAKKYKCSVFAYKKAEYDQPITDFFYDNIIPHAADNEKCVIYRRRAHLLQKDVAKKIGVSRYWINLQEKGEKDCTKLLAWWTALSD